MAIASCNGVTVGIYQSNLPHDCKYIINHSDAVVIFAEDQKQFDKLVSIRADIPNIRKVILFKGKGTGDGWAISFDEFLALGKDVSDEKLQERFGAAGPSDPAAIVYTSGTTGVPKGAVLTHDNLTFTAQSARECADIHEGDNTFLFLPLAHVFARLCVYFSVLTGTCTTFARSIDTLVDDLKASEPDWFTSVPRIYEKVYARLISGAEAKGGLALKIFRWACAVGNEISDDRLNKQPIPAVTAFKYKIATKLVFSKPQLWRKTP